MLTNLPLHCQIKQPKTAGFFATGNGTGLDIFSPDIDLPSLDLGIPFEKVACVIPCQILNLNLTC